MKIGVTAAQMSADLLALIADDTERAGAAAKSARADTISIYATDGAGALVGYAVAGLDTDGMVTIYQARSFVTGFGALAWRAVIGAADVLGAPVRVHADRLKPLMRMGGVREALAAIDTDGVPMGIFGHGQ